MTSCIRKWDFCANYFLIPIKKKGFELLVHNENSTRISGQLVKIGRKNNPAYIDAFCYTSSTKNDCHINIDETGTDTSIWIGSAAFGIQTEIGLAAATLFDIRIWDDRPKKAAA